MSTALCYPLVHRPCSPIIALDGPALRRAEHLTASFAPVRGHRAVGRGPGRRWAGLEDMQVSSKFTTRS